MDIHKPKPFHSLREFASEVVIIVVGVALALAGEQAIEWLSWKHRAEEARQAIALDLGESVGQGEERVRLGPCFAAELDRLARIVDDAAAGGRLPPLGAIERRLRERGTPTPSATRRHRARPRISRAASRPISAGPTASSSRCAIPMRPSAIRGRGSPRLPGRGARLARRKRSRCAMPSRRRGG